MLVTRETDYAVRCVLYLANDKDRFASVTEISKAMHIPKTFLAKILQRLVRNKIVESIRGMKGGFRIAKKPAEISLLDVMEAIQGCAVINVCAVDSKLCNRSSVCAVHPIWVEIRREVEQRLKRETIDKLMQEQTGT